MGVPGRINNRWNRWNLTLWSSIDSGATWVARHLFWHEWAKFSNGADSLDTATTIQVGVTPGGRLRAGADKAGFHACAKCKLGNSYSGSKVTVHFQLDGTCRCRWRDGSWTDGRWHERSESQEERDGLCELCEELCDDAMDGE